MKSIKVFAPATVANVGSGFDILGFALETPGDEIILRERSGPGIKIINSTSFELPDNPAQNVAGISLNAFLDHIDSSAGYEIEFTKKIKPGSGLGSSAASAVASVFAANQLLGCPLRDDELLPFAMEGEKFITGVAHADNVGPALLGGFVLIRSYNPLDIIRIPCPENFFISIVHPQIEIKTIDARKVLKTNVTLEDAIKQWGNVGGLIAGLMKQDIELVGRSLEDVIIEPVRSMLIPGYHEVKAAALAAGALGCSISGSGPSIFALCRAKKDAEEVGKCMQETFNSFEIISDVYVSTVCTTGPKIQS